MTRAAIGVEDVTLAYDGHPAVHHLSGRFAAGSLTAITGPNGAGKSTLLKALLGEMAPAGGRIDRDGCSLRDLGYLPQSAEIDRGFPLTVADTILLGAWRRCGPFGGVTRATAAAAHEALAQVGLEGFERRMIRALSVGQFQRALFARLLLRDAEVILLDEPFAAIDSQTTQDCLEIVLRWHREGRTVIAVLHDFDTIRRHFPDTLLLAREAIAWGSTAGVLTPANLARARAMVEAWDAQAERCTLVPTAAP